jgi:hypothetical protein
MPQCTPTQHNTKKKMDMKVEGGLFAKRKGPVGGGGGRTREDNGG